jgi:hypothetical protein
MAATAFVSEPLHTLGDGLVVSEEGRQLAKLLREHFHYFGPLMSDHHIAQAALHVLRLHNCHNHTNHNHPQHPQHPQPPHQAPLTFQELPGANAFLNHVNCLTLNVAMLRTRLKQVKDAQAAVRLQVQQQQQQQYHDQHHYCHRHPQQQFPTSYNQYGQYNTQHQLHSKDVYLRPSLQFTAVMDDALDSVYRQTTPEHIAYYGGLRDGRAASVAPIKTAEPGPSALSPPQQPVPSWSEWNSGRDPDTHHLPNNNNNNNSNDDNSINSNHDGYQPPTMHSVRSGSAAPQPQQHQHEPHLATDAQYRYTAELNQALTMGASLSSPSSHQPWFVHGTTFFVICLWIIPMYFLASMLHSGSIELSSAWSDSTTSMTTWRFPLSISSQNTNTGYGYSYGYGLPVLEAMSVAATRFFLQHIVGSIILLIIISYLALWRYYARWDTISDANWQLAQSHAALAKLAGHRYIYRERNHTLAAMELLGRPCYLPTKHTTINVNNHEEGEDMSPKYTGSTGTLSPWGFRLWVGLGLYFEIVKLITIWTRVGVPLERWLFMTSKRDKYAAHLSVEMGIRYLRRLQLGSPPAVLMYMALRTYNLARISNAPMLAEVSVVQALVVDIILKGGGLAQLREYTIDQAVQVAAEHDRFEALYHIYGLRALTNFEKGHWTATRATVASLLHVDTMAIKKNLAKLHKLESRSRNKKGDDNGDDCDDKEGEHDDGTTTADGLLGDIKDNYDAWAWGLAMLSGVEFAHGKFAQSLAWAKLALSVLEAAPSPFPLVSCGLLQFHTALICSSTSTVAVRAAMKMEEATLGEYLKAELVRGLTAEMAHYGLRALAHWRLGNFEEALVAADKASIILKTMPQRSRMIILAIHFCLPTFVEAYLELWEFAIAEDLPSAHALRERVLSSLALLESTLSSAPVLEPEIERLRGWSNAIQGHLTEATRCWKRSIQACRSLVSPYCEAKVLFLAGVYLDRPSQLLNLDVIAPAYADGTMTSKDALMLSRSLFERLGAGYDAQQCSSRLQQHHQ